MSAELVSSKMDIVETGNETSSATVNRTSTRTPSVQQPFKERHPVFNNREETSNNIDVPPDKPAVVDDTLKLKMESARGRLESSKSNLRSQRPPNTASSNHHVSFTRTKNKTSYQLPIIYFVVNKDRMPRLAESFAESDRNAPLKAYATKSRHQFLMKRREKKRQRDEDVKRVKNIGTKVGLKVEPAKTFVIPNMSRSWLSKQPTTPFNTMSERSELESPETVFFNHDDLPDGGKARGSSAGSNEFNMSEGWPEKPKLLPFDIELPGLKTSGNRSDTPGSTSSKKVRFAKKKPRSKSCSIQLPKVDQSAEEFQEAEQKQSTKCQTPKRSKTVLPVTNTPNSKPRRDANPLSLPKIDLITPIYDELILKTFQAFMTKKNPLSDSNTRAILQRVSAFLHPLDQTPRTSDRKTPSSRPRTRETSFFSTEPPEECPELELTDVSSTSITIDGKSMSMLMRDVESKQRRPQIQSTCFQMPPPGLERGETENFQPDRRPDIYIPTSC